MTTPIYDNDADAENAVLELIDPVPFVEDQGPQDEGPDSEAHCKKWDDMSDGITTRRQVRMQLYIRRHAC